MCLIWDADAITRGSLSVGREERVLDEVLVGSFCCWRPVRMDWVLCDERMVVAWSVRWAFKEDTVTYQYSARLERGLFTL